MITAIVQTKDQGAYFGSLSYLPKAGEAIKMTNARRLYRWAGASTCEEIAAGAPHALAVGFGWWEPEVYLSEVVAVFPVNKKENDHE